MMDKAKEPSKQRKASGASRAARRTGAAAADVARVRRDFSEPEPLHGWREEGSPPSTVHQGTAAELAERFVAEALEQMRAAYGLAAAQPGAARGHGRVSVGKRREEAAVGGAMESVPVPADLLRAARARTGIRDSAELVRFALSLLAEPQDDGFMDMLGSLPGHTLEY